MGGLSQLLQFHGKSSDAYEKWLLNAKTITQMGAGFGREPFFHRALEIC